MVLPFPNQQIPDHSRLKKSADNNFKFNENGGKYPKRVEKTAKNALKYRWVTAILL